MIVSAISFFYFNILFYYIVLNNHLILGKLIEEGKITFKKPEKRKAENDEKGTDEKKVKETSKPIKKVDSRLLSFNQDEDEE